jgi:hypothetical protein
MATMMHPLLLLLVQGFVRLGALLPSFHTRYWMGLNATPASGGWPKFEWIASDLAPPASSYSQGGGYGHWAAGQPDNGKALSGRTAAGQQVAAAAGPELCVAAAAAGGYNGAWAWHDSSCAEEAMWMCKMASGWLQAPAVL